MLQFLSIFLLYGINLTPSISCAILKTDKNVEALGGISVFVILSLGMILKIQWVQLRYSSYTFLKQKDLSPEQY